MPTSEEMQFAVPSPRMPVVQAPESVQVPIALAKPGQPSSPRPMALWRKVVIAILIVSIIGLLIYQSRIFKSSGTNDFKQSLTQTVNQVIKQEHRTRLMESSVTVEPSHWLIKQFVINPEMMPAGVVGKFLSSGGSGNDIKVYVVDDEGLANVKNRHRAKYYYYSDKVTAGSLNLRLNPGRYYLVFDNTFSIFSNKVVQSDIELIYQE